MTAQYTARGLALGVLDECHTGNAFVHTLSGQSGNDRIDGGKANDVLTGGNGADTFVFEAIEREQEMRGNL